jgi:HAD superfamily hydrolase (TIGR01459 family)
MPEPRFVDGVRAFADRYEAFVLDQWGVLHDGAEPYPGALEAVAELARRGKRIVLLSNSGRRADRGRERLRALGFDTALFADVVSSGEATWQLMRARAGEPWGALGRRCVLLTHLGDRGVVEGLDLEVVEDVADADFVFASGLEASQTPEGLRPLAEAAVARGLPMVCSNPDIVAVSRGGAFHHAPGAFARVYEGLGGKVHYVGKPHRPIYEACLAALDGVDRTAIVCVGDSLNHDIRGAAGVGLDSAFVTGGIHAAEFPAGADPDAARAALARLCGEAGARPTWVVRALAW